MSYARFAEDSDVYVFLSIAGSLECCGCALASSDGNRHFPTTDGMVAHLREHQERGHMVPVAAFDRLEQDRAENDAWIAEERRGSPGS